MKNSTDTIGNRTRDLPTCGTVPQRTAQPRAPHLSITLENDQINAQIFNTFITILYMYMYMYMYMYKVK